ncbi:hypothetical protein PM082_016520 [Marasmius tenuissimus]|nr:hypothetical protein PM082_016520 [Marasmius tenuissimus]
MFSTDSEPSLEDMVAPFLRVEAVIVQPIITMIVMYFVYGFYCLLFGIAVRTLLKYREQDRKMNFSLQLTWVALLFVVSTLTTVLETWGMIRQSITEYKSARSRDFEGLFGFLTDDVGNDTWFIMENTLPVVQKSHRCYIIWSSNRAIGYTLGMMSFILNAFGFATCIIGAIALRVPGKIWLYPVGGKLNTGFSYASPAFNVVLTLLTAVRIWWITREARRTMGPSVATKYRTIVALILETGVLYPAFQLTTIILNSTIDPQSNGLIPINLLPLSVQAAVSTSKRSLTPEKKLINY